MKRKKEFVEADGENLPIRRPQPPKNIPHPCGRYPNQEYYIKSYMHREMCSHLLISKANDFVISGSVDGHVKFWKILDYEHTNTGELDFVKDYRAHFCPITDMKLNKDSTMLASISDQDKSLKIFHVLTFDMICMCKLDYIPCSLAFANNEYLVIAEAESNAKSFTNSYQLLYRDQNLHQCQVKILVGHSKVGLLSIDTSGFVELSEVTYDKIKIAAHMQNQSKLDTDLFSLLKMKRTAKTAQFSADGLLFSIGMDDGATLVFRTKTAKIAAKLELYAEDERSEGFSESEKTRRKILNEDFLKLSCVTSIGFDTISDHYVLAVPDPLGIRLCKLNDKGDDSLQTVGRVGGQDMLRFTNAIIWSEKPQLSNERAIADVRIFALAWKKNRVYIFTNGPTVLSVEYERRDVCNEHPLSSAAASATGDQRGADGKPLNNLPTTAVIHTSIGDMFCQLYSNECPKTVENFCQLSRTGYYNDNIFHRVIRQFMIQTGDPEGTGSGGKSMWGNDFEDEIHPDLKHDKPYAMSMANAGPNTNGSQFFITVVSCPWLDGKHTIFGRVVRGMDVVHRINNLKTDKHDKPLDETKILNISIK